jgi:hypothetical protein
MSNCPIRGKLTTTRVIRVGYHLANFLLGIATTTVHFVGVSVGLVLFGAAFTM